MTSLIRTFLPAVLALGLLAGYPEVLWAQAQPTALKKEQEGRLARQICVSILESNHYNHQKLDDEISKRAFREMFKILDAEKKFFLQSDYENFRPHETSLDDELRRGDLSFVYKLREVYEQRVSQWLDEVPSLLKQPMDFTKEEVLELDGEKKDFASTVEDLRDRWYKLLKYQVLTRKIAKDRANRMSKEKKADAEILESIHQDVLKGYERIRRYAVKQRAPKLVEIFLNAVATVFDPHTAYFPPSEFENFNISMKLKLEGIGAALSSQDGYTKVVRIIPGSPADKGGELQPEDVILEVAQEAEEAVNVVDMDLDEVVKLIRGKKGTTVKLTVRPAGATDDSVRKVIGITRDEIKLEDQSAKLAVYEFGEGEAKKKFGYIRVPSFYRDFEKAKLKMAATEMPDGISSAVDVAELLRKLEGQNPQGIIVDLRNNGGGSLPDAIQMGGLFIREGPVVQVQDAQRHTVVENDPDPQVLYSGPLLVLVNQFSASASEIFAAAMMDYKRAIVVGNLKTHGKGTVQTLVDLDKELGVKGSDTRLGAVKLTISKFYRVTGHTTQKQGVTPDILLPGLYDGIKVGEESLDYCFPDDEISATPYVEFGPGAADLARLRERSAERVRSSLYFQNLKLQSEVLAKNRNDTLIYLMEADMVRRSKEARNIALEGARIRRQWQLQQQLITPEEYRILEERDAREDDSDQEEAEKEEIKFTDKLRRMSPEEREAWDARAMRDQVVEEAMHILSDATEIQQVGKK
ncbi:MAG: carboxy terminal-processing peptidase [Planctomycetes bacterium]|nr:carboxy terminal-processing peptidase [Planctomycetota bacterium]